MKNHTLISVSLRSKRVQVIARRSGQQKSLSQNFCTEISLRTFLSISVTHLYASFKQWHTSSNVIVNTKCCFHKILIWFEPTNIIEIMHENVYNAYVIMLLVAFFPTSIMISLLCLPLQFGTEPAEHWCTPDIFVSSSSCVCVCALHSLTFYLFNSNITSCKIENFNLIKAAYSVKWAESSNLKFGWQCHQWSSHDMGIPWFSENKKMFV